MMPRTGNSATGYALRSIPRARNAQQRLKRRISQTGNSLHLSTVAKSKGSYPSWVKIESAGWVRIQSARTSLSKLSPAIARNSTKIGRLNGNFDLDGRGDSIGNMLASANGKVIAVLEGGQVSKLLMEKVGLHLWEILTLSLTGDRMVKLRCAVAAFDVTHGKMQATAIVFDTQVTTVYGTGSIDLAQEELDLVLEPRTKDTSPFALRSPIFVRGSFAKPEVEFDKVKIVVRAAGALAIGSVNPLFALVPLVDAGPGKDSDCYRIWREAGAGPSRALAK